MPGNSWAPPIALMTEVDTTLYSGGVDILSVGASTFRNGYTTTHYDDPVAWLNGRGSPLGHDLQAEIQSAATVAGFTAGWVSSLTPTVQALLGLGGMPVPDNDRIYIACSTGAFDLLANADNPTYGFTAAGVSSVSVGGVHYIVGGLEWVRGHIVGKHLNLDPAAGAAFTVPAEGFASQSLPTLMRSSATSDDDSTYAGSSFERGLNADVDNASKRFRCYIDSTGRTVIAAPSLAAFADPVWLSDDAREYLGYSGLEVVTSVPNNGTHAVDPGATDLWVSTYRCAGALCPASSYPARRLDVDQTWDGEAKRIRSGAVTVTRRLSRLSYSLTFVLPGPARGSDDLRQHFIDRWLPTVHPGDRVSLYQHWGDPRRARRGYDVRMGLTIVAPDYSTLYTAEMDGERGRLILRRGLGQQSVTVSYPSGPRVESEVTMALDAYVEG